MAKLHRYFFLRADDLSDRGYNIGIEVYKLTKGYPKFIGGNYRIHSGSWKGDRAVARELIAEKCSHKLPDSYRDFPAKNVTLRDISGR